MECIKKDNALIKVKTNKIVVTNIILLLSAQLISLFGTQVYNFALALYVLNKTGSGKTFAAMMVCSIIPKIIFGPFAGIAADKIDRKLMLVAADFFSGICVFLFLSDSYAFGMTLTLIYITNLILSTISMFYGVSLSAAIPNLTDDKNLVRVNSLSQAISSLAQIAGPILGGIIFAFVNIKLFLLINAVSFIVSAIFEIFIDFNINKQIQLNKSDKKPGGLKGIRDDFKEGISFLKVKKSITILIIFSILLNFLLMIGMVIPFPYIVNTVIKLSAAQYGIIDAVFSAGIIIGAVLLSILPEKKKKYKGLILGLILFSIGITFVSLPIMTSFIAFSKFKAFIFYIALMVLLGIIIAYINLPIDIFLQREIPDDIRGRVMGMSNTLGMISSPLGMIIAGILLDMIPAFILPLISGIVLLMVSVFMALNKEIKKI